MKLSADDVALFYKLNPALLFYVNQKLKIIKNVSSVDKFMSLSPNDKFLIINSLYDHIDLIDSFVKKSF